MPIMELSTVSSICSDYSNLVGEGNGIEGGNDTHGSDSCATITADITADTGMSNMESPCDNGSDSGTDSDGSDGGNDGDDSDTSLIDSFQFERPTKCASKKRNFNRIPVYGVYFNRIPVYGVSSPKKQSSPSTTTTPLSKVDHIPRAVSETVRQKKQARRAKRRLNPRTTSPNQHQPELDTVTSDEEPLSSLNVSCDSNLNSPRCQKQAQRAARKRAHRRSHRAAVASDMSGFEFTYEEPSPSLSPPIKRARTAARKKMNRKKYRATKRRRDANVDAQATPQKGASAQFIVAHYCNKCYTDFATFKLYASVCVVCNGAFDEGNGCISDGSGSSSASESQSPHSTSPNFSKRGRKKSPKKRADKRAYRASADNVHIRAYRANYAGMPSLYVYSGTFMFYYATGIFIVTCAFLS